jgi:hypothetical protein
MHVVDKFADAAFEKQLHAVVDSMLPSAVTTSPKKTQ